MPAVSVTDTWSDLLSTTLRNIKAEVADNIFNEFVFLRWLDSRGGVRRNERGGFNIGLPVNYAKNATARAYSGYEAADTTPQNTTTMSFWEWKFYDASISISDEEMLKNSSVSHP